MLKFQQILTELQSNIVSRHMHCHPVKLKPFSGVAVYWASPSLILNVGSNITFLCTANVLLSIQQTKISFLQCCTLDPSLILNVGSNIVVMPARSPCNQDCYNWEKYLVKYYTNFSCISLEC